MVELKYEANKVVALEHELRNTKEHLNLVKHKLGAKKDLYHREWLETIERKLEDTGRTWCTWCKQLIYKEKATERYDLYSKSDNYSPVFAHTSTKHRVCTTCAPKLSSPKEAKKFEAMFNKDATQDEMPEKVRDQAAELFDMPPYNPTKETYGSHS